MMVTDSGHVWQWSVAVPALAALPPPMAAGAGAAAAALLKPRLLGANSQPSNSVLSSCRYRETRPRCCCGPCVEEKMGFLVVASLLLLPGLLTKPSSDPTTRICPVSNLHA